MQIPSRCLPQFIHSEKRQTGQNKGQIVVEYILLLIVAVSLAALIVRVLVHRDPDNPGAVIKAWTGIVEFISDDKPDDVAP